MVKGTMKWTSTTKEFGLLTPDDGGRDVFVRFTSAIASLCISDSHGEAVHVKDLVAPIHPRHKLASKVEVRTRYQPGHWASGYEIAEVLDSGCRVRRSGSLEILPEIVVPTDVRRAGEEW